MNRIAIAAALAAVLIAPIRAHAAEGEPLHAPNTPTAQFLGNPSFFGPSTYEMETSTPTDTPVLLVSGPGYLYGIQCSSGAAADYAIAYDSASSSGITIATRGKAITASVMSPGLTATGGTNGGNIGNASFNSGGFPKRFKLGLVGITHGTGPNCFFDALSDAQIKAGAH